MLEAHQLTDYQKVNQLLKMESLGARRPSELLAVMLETSPSGQETNNFFTHLFLCRLPAELRIMLSEDDHQDVRNLVSKADKPWALHGKKSSLVASVDQLEEDSAVIPAVGATRDAADAAAPATTPTEVSSLPVATSLSLATSRPPSSLVSLCRLPTALRGLPT